MSTSIFKTALYTMLPLVSFAGVTVGCASTTEQHEDEHVGAAEQELTAAQCNYFAVDGKVQICHRTASTTKPYTILKISEQACVNAHAVHAGDYVAVNDPQCQGVGCLPENAPCDPTVPCCDGFSCTNGTCTPNVSNHCDPSPCQNGGSCVNNPSGYTCECPAGYTGTNCETEIDECASSPCQNGANCLDGINAYVCECAPGYTGTNCEIDIDDCASAPCVNGECIDQVNGYACSCTPGYDGVNCENNIDECASAPCVNGTCTDQVNGYTCSCTPGYDGVNCENNIDDCASGPCQNGGTCVDGLNKYTCSCPVGWIGASCQTAAVFAPPVSAITGSLNTQRIADFNNDGHLDVFAFSSGGLLRLSLGNGDGTFQASISATAGLVGPGGESTLGVSAYTIGDYNRDGNVDFLVNVGSLRAPLYLDRWYVLGLGNGDGTFQYQNFGMPNNYAPNIDALISADFNGDGNLDLAGFILATVTDPFEGLALTLGNGDGTFQPVSHVMSFAGVAISKAADLNNDGHLDLAFSTGPQTYVLLGNGDGTFLSPATYGVAGELVTNVVVVDLNGDGAQDLLSMTAPTRGIRPLLNNGDGTFQIGPATSFSSGIRGITVGDWDGDGHVDVAATMPQQGSVNVRHGNGDGTFQAETLYSGFAVHPSLGPWSIEARDFDENGSLDLLVGGQINGYRFMRNLNVSVDACNPNPCQNGGTCSLDGNSYTCSCTPLWTGTTCNAPHTYDCVNDNPCTQANLDLGMNKFPASSGPGNVIECVSVGQCNEYSCQPGQVYDPIMRICQ